MNTPQMDRPKKSFSRVFAVSTALGIALAAGSATAASAVAATSAHVATKATVAQSLPTGGHDDFGGACVIVLLCN
ncbi:hypothetical protein AB0I10_33350 [Streptomyces sp. NPDC050636]|uniref:hypothetical protein n=1 Tax=Streptomyces sp. NPDC050636 TaxID=3154510 RepID=UPI003440F7B3